MSPANWSVTFYLKTPATASMNGGLGLDISKNVTQETGTTITSEIEKGDGINDFVIPDVSIKGRDRSGNVQYYLRQIQPLSTDFYLTTTQNFIAEGFWNSYPMMMILPNTLVFDEVEKSFSFTAVHVGRNAALTDATPLFQNRTRQYFSYTGYISRWAVHLLTSKQSDWVWIRDLLQLPTSDLYPGDRITFVAGATESSEYRIISVVPQGSSVYQLRLSEAPDEYANNTQVILKTIYDRGVPLQQIVETLFAAVPQTTGLVTYLAGQLPGVSTPFPTPLSIVGLSGAILGINPYIDVVNAGKFGDGIMASASTGIYLLSNPPAGPWTLFAPVGNFDRTAPLLDPSNYNANLAIFGKRRDFFIATASKGKAGTFNYYGYWFNYNNSNFIRYRLELSFNEDMTEPPYSWSLILYQQTSTDARTWGNETTAWSGESGTTSDMLSLHRSRIGIDVDPISGVVIFTDIHVATAGGEATWQTSAYVPGVGVTRGVTSFRSVPVITAPGRIALFRDGSQGQTPNVITYHINSDGTLSQFGTQQLPVGIVPYSVKYNPGDNKWYGLVNVPNVGLVLRKFLTYLFAPDPAEPDLILEIGGPGVQDEYPELIVWRRQPVSGRCPMVALRGPGSTPALIDTQFAGAVGYADMTDLKVGDALQHLSILVGAYVYYDRAGNGVFRTRSTPSGNWVAGGGNARLDDANAITIRVQSIWAKTTLFVRVENDNDDTIYGEAGDVRFRDDDSLGLTISSRFVMSKSYATVIASGLLAYLGQQKRWIEIDRLMDHRSYELGNLFQALVDGSLRTFQIIGLQQPAFAKNIKVIGVEL